MTLDILQRVATGILTNGVYASAFIGLSVFIMGMIIVYLTPEQRPKQ